MKKTYNIWDLLDKYFSEYPQDMVGPVESKEIDLAEKELDLTFNDAYKKFIMVYGGACVGSNLVYGLRKQKDMGKELFNVLTINFFYRVQNWPDIENWYIISDDGSGNPIGIDPEGKVWLSDHDSGFEQIKLADSFEEFLYKLLTDTLYE